MTARQLYDLLQEVPDTREIVVRSDAGDGLVAAWRAAQDESTRALAGWRQAPGREAFAAFRAATDRADAAQDALAAGL
jgi:acyl-homoserine lactone acylase PvdQ